MSDVDLATFCCKKDVDRLYAPGRLEKLVSSNRHRFQRLIIIHQQVEAPRKLSDVEGVPVTQLELDDPRRQALFFIQDEEDVRLADDHCGEGHHHVWFRHLANHLLAAEASGAEYMVFMDCDCYIRDSQGPRSWVADGIEVLNKYPEVLYVCPNWGQGAGESVKEYPECHLHKTTSQQVILIQRKTLLELDWGAKWTWDMPKAPGEPDAWFYWVLEGRLWRHMRDHDMFRASLKKHRWWHDGWH